MLLAEQEHAAGSNRKRMLRFAFPVWVLLGAFLFSGCATTGTEKVERTLADEWGVEIQSVRLTAAEYMIDFRYKVLDAKKALPILDRTIKPHLIVERTGAKLQVPISAKLGPLRQATTSPIDGRSYFTFFANPGRHVVVGDTVTVVVGDFVVENLTVY
jgi:hypothetical protein